MTCNVNGVLVLQILDLHLVVINQVRDYIIRDVGIALLIGIEERTLQLVHVHGNGPEILDNFRNRRHIALASVRQEDGADIDLALLNSAKKLVAVHTRIDDRA